MIDFAHPDEDDAPELDAADERLALLLARGLSQQAASRKVGLSARTVRRRLADPAFIARVAAFRRDLMGEAVGILSGMASSAARTLKALLEDDSPKIRLAAADKILTHQVRLQELMTLSERIAELEAERLTGSTTSAQW